jgi:hypothetical protein
VCPAEATIQEPLTEKARPEGKRVFPIALISVDFPAGVVLRDMRRTTASLSTEFYVHTNPDSHSEEKRRLTTGRLFVHEGRCGDDRVLELFMSTQEVDGLADVDLSEEGGGEEIPDQQSTIGGACDELKKVVGVDEGGGESWVLGGRALWDGEEELGDDQTTGD